MILYEYPFNERVRTYLRLEQLFGRLAELNARSSALDHHFALVTMFEIMDVGTRADLKSDVLKDLDRQKQLFSAYRGNPSINEEVLEEVLVRIETYRNALNQKPGKFAQSLADSEWLMSVRSRISIPGGTCNFDLPAYYAWQHEPAEARQQALTYWSQAFSPLGESVSLLLQFLRSFAPAQKALAPNGHFQQQLPSGRSFQLLRLEFDPELRVVPEISANRLVVSIRFLQQDQEGRSVKAGQDIEFSLTLCAG